MQEKRCINMLSQKEKNMFISHILLDSFSDLDKMLLVGNHPSQNCSMSIRIGDVEQNNLLHKNSALEVTLNFNPSNKIYKSIFKGHNIAEIAVEWAFKIAKDYFEPVNNKDAVLNRIKSQIVQELSVISKK